MSTRFASSMALGHQRGDQHEADLWARTGRSRTQGLLNVQARSREQSEQSHIADGWVNCPGDGLLQRNKIVTLRMQEELHHAMNHVYVGASV